MQTRVLVISGLNCVILHEFARHSSFTRPGDIIIDSSRSGTCFSSCLASSTHFSITQTIICLRYNFLLCQRPPMSTPFNPFLDPAVYKSILPREWRIAIPASLMRIDKQLKPASDHAEHDANPFAPLVQEHSGQST